MAVTIGNSSIPVNAISDKSDFNGDIISSIYYSAISASGWRPV